MMTDNQKREILELLQKQIFLYGFLPLLKLLKDYEQKEEYDMCQIIQSALRIHGNKYKFRVPAAYNKNAVGKMMFYMQSEFGLSGETALLNTWYYAEKIEQELHKYCLNIAHNFLKDNSPNP